MSMQLGTRRSEVMSQVHNFLATPANGSRVIMLCGLAGAGKSTVSKMIIQHHPSVHRLSTDQIIYSMRGLYGIDYRPSEYESLQVEAKATLEEQFIQLLREGQDVVLDRSFWSRSDRETCYAMMKREGAGAHRLVHLRGGKEFLWRRIQTRSEGMRNADCALDISSTSIGPGSKHQQQKRNP